MKKSTMIWFIIGGALILAGGMIFCIVMSNLGWDFTRLDTNKYETNVYEFEESVGQVKIDISAADITFKPSEDGKTKIVCYENTKIPYTVKLKNGVLKINEEDNRKWYDHIGIGFNRTKIDVYLSVNNALKLEIDASTGDINIAKDFKLLNAEIDVTTGDVECLAYIAKNINIKSTTGDIKIVGTAAESIRLVNSSGIVLLENTKCERLSVKGVTGEVTLKNALVEQHVYIFHTSGDVIMRNVNVGDDTYIGTTTGDVAFYGGFGADLNVKTTTGDVKLDNFDANEMNIETTTGDVTGTLRTSKFFMVDTTTGDVNVERYWRGHQCNIKTSSGDVSIECLAIDEDGPFWIQ